MGHELTDEQLNEIAERIAANLVTARADRTNWERRIQLVLGIFAVVSLVFSLGINWSRIANAETKIKDGADERHALSDRLTKVELSIISQEGSTNLITQQLSVIQSDVKEIKTRVYK